MTAQKSSKLSFASQAVYYDPEPATKSIAAPIYVSANYQYDEEIYQRIVDGARKDVNI